MADRNGGTVAIRLSVKDGDVVRRALQSVGRDGESALKKLDAAGKQPTRTMLAVNDAMKDIGQTAQGMTARLGPAGTALQALGPWGIAAGAGLAAAGTGLMALKNAAADLANIRASAMTAGLDPEIYQELSYAAQMFRVETSALTDGIKEMQLRTHEFVQTGSGPGAEAFRLLGMNAGELATKLQDPVKLFEEILDRARKLDRAAQIRVFDELFGGSAGEQFVRLLDESVGKVSDLRKEAREVGFVFVADLLDRAAEIDREFLKISLTVGTVLKGAVVETGSALFEMLEKFRTSSPPDWFFAWLEWVKAGGVPGSIYRGFAGGDNNASDGVENTELRGREGMYTPAPWVPLPQSRPGGRDLFDMQDQALATKRTEQEKAAAQAVRDRAQADRESIQIMREAAQIRLELGDYTEALRLEEERLRELVDKGALSEEQYTEALKRRKDELIEITKRLDEGAEAGERFGQVLGDALVQIGIEGKSAREVLHGLFKMIASQAFSKGFGMIGSGLGSGGGFFGTLAGWLGFDEGGYTGNARRDEIAGVVHGREFVVNAEATARNRDLLEAINSGAMPGYLSGGYVQPSVGGAPVSSGAAMSGLNVSISLDSDMLRATVTDEAGRVVARAAPGIADAAVRKSSANVVPVMAQHERDVAGSDYRL